MMGNIGSSPQVSRIIVSRSIIGHKTTTSRRSDGCSQNGSSAIHIRNRADALRPHVHQPALLHIPAALPPPIHFATLLHTLLLLLRVPSPSPLHDSARRPEYAAAWAPYTAPPRRLPIPGVRARPQKVSQLPAAQTTNLSWHISPTSSFCDATHTIFNWVAT